VTDAAASSWVDWAQIISGAASAIALGFNAYAITSQNRATAISTLNAFLDRSKKYERELRESVGTTDFVYRFTDYINHLEILATCVNKRLYPKIPRNVARNRLVQDISILQTTKGASELLSSRIVSPDTFGDLRIFVGKNKKPISEASKAYREFPSE
jgi:hypothetical protein